MPDSFADYRAIEALNWSSLKLMENPREYQWRQRHPRPDTAALTGGTTKHLYLLEPEEFSGRVVVRPSEWTDWRKKAAREWRDEMKSARRVVVTDDELEEMRIIRESLAGHADSSRLLADTRREETIQWTVDGITAKGRLDAVAADRIVDLKTTRDLKWFSKDAAEFCYHGQLAWYLDGAIAAGACSADAVPYIVAVETGEPYDCAAFRLSETVIDAGRWLWRDLLDKWLACRDADIWPGRHPSLEVLDLPTWAPGMRPDEEGGF